ncbi:MAG: hypothetical protein AAFQ94_02700 [Bacteroidota bacterium]
MPKRTQIQDFESIEKADDLNRIVKDKRSDKRANKAKGKRRNRHYTKTLLKHLTESGDDYNES